MNGNANGGREELLKKVQALGFAKTEAELFLDTHPDCKQALEYHRDVTEKLKAAAEEYSAKYSPLTAGAVLGDKWSWANGAWPWQEKEG